MSHNISLEAAAVALNQVVVQKDRELQQKMRVGLEFEADLPFVQAEHTYMATNAEISNLLQPYQSQFTPNNTETWDSVENTLEHGKVDMEFDIAQLEELYDTMLANYFELDKSPDLYDYAQLILNELVQPKLMEEINDASYNGVRANPTPGTAGNPRDSWNGYKKIITDAVAAGSITPIATGALQEATMEEQVREFCAGLPEAYRFRPGIIYMSATRALQYAEDYRANHPRQVDIVNNSDTPYYRVDNYQKVIKPMHCMAGSDRIIWCPETSRNMIIGNRIGQSPYPRYRFQVFDRTLKVLSEMSRFYGFRYWGHLFVNDQE